ncbi:MAG TPA: hypothetical protein VFW21_00495, partial [Mycobacterium sp.]|nr:hypothetical protein [Mycobacterium sp.]
MHDVDGIFEAAFAGVSAAGPFDDAVVSVFGQVVWALQGQPLLATVSGPTIELLVAATAGRLAVLAERSGCGLADPGALADIFVRLAHAVVSVPDPLRPLTSREDVEDYARRNLQPLARSLAVTQNSRATSRRRSVSVVSALLATMFLGSAGVAAALAHPWDLLRPGPADSAPAHPAATTVAD